MPHLNPYDSITTPFQSGCSTCNKSSDYSRIDGLNKPSSSADLKNNGYTGDMPKPQAHDLMSSNWGVVTNSTGGAKKKKSKKSKKKVIKRSGKKVVRRSKKVIKKSAKKVVRRSKKVVKRSVSRVKKTGKRVVKGSKKLVKRSTNGVKKTVKRVSRTVRRVSKPVVNKIKNLGRLLGIKVSKKVKKSKRVKKSKKQRGGDSNWGSTGMPSRWYNPKAPSISNNASNPNDGGGLATSKGLVVHNLTDKNFGTPSKYTGKVEPYNPSASEWANVSGGAKKKKKSKGVKKSKKVKKSKGVKKSKKKSPKKKASQKK